MGAKLVETQPPSKGPAAQKRPRWSRTTPGPHLRPSRWQVRHRKENWRL